jgi:hypothetical protein
LNLDRAYDELYRGLGFLEAGPDEPRLAELRRLLDESLSGFRAGDEKKAAFLLQDFERLAFGA